jgi:hypothetical protein
MFGSDSIRRNVAGRRLVGELMHCAAGQRRNDPIRSRTVAIGI